eukprot:3558037-Pleurochrysis_carterae.AAC.2
MGNRVLGVCVSHCGPCQPPRIELTSSGRHGSEAALYDAVVARCGVVVEAWFHRAGIANCRTYRLFVYLAGFSVSQRFGDTHAGHKGV